MTTQTKQITIYLWIAESKQKTLFNNPPKQYEITKENIHFTFILSSELPTNEPDLIITKRVKPTGEQAEQMKQYEKDHPNVPFWESSEMHDILNDRQRTNEIMTKHNINMPPSFHVSSKQQLLNLIETNKLPYPIIVKRINAQGTFDAHQMKILLEKEGVEEVEYPCLCQQYVNHDNKIMKIFTIGDHFIYETRTSLPNINRTGVVSLDFNNQRLTDLLNWPDGVIDKTTIDVSNPTRFGNVVLGDSIQLGMTTMDEMKELVQSIRNAFGITLVGIDFIKENSTGKPLIIDLNIFPSYGGKIEMDWFCNHIANHYIKVFLK